MSKNDTKLKIVHPLSGKMKKRASFDELLLSGISAVAAKGVDHTNVSDVAATSGVSRPTFYTYFGDMNGFYAEVWLRYGRPWLDAQLVENADLSPEIDQALLEIFAVARRIPEVLEVVQPDFERWWQEQTAGEAIAAQRLVWKLGFTLGYKMSRHVTQKSDFGLAIVSFLNLPDDAMSLPFLSGLGKVDPSLLPPMQGLTLDDDIVEASLTLATKEVIASSGVAAASMTRIARRARVSTGTVYPRFKNSETLIQSSFTKAIANIVGKNVAIVAERGLGIDEYALTVNAGYGPNRKTWRDFRTEMHVEAAHNPELAKFMESGFEAAAKFLEDSFLEFGIPRHLATPIAWFLHSHAIGISIIYNALPSVADIDYRIMARWMISQLPK
ncbi:MAG: TetR/AcrR family transcriptional regulator [Rhodoluna sp.]|nr:TetR/AcrR family transcriptional regulator [Rhodoluna sp.]